jgi:hypothetical protein
VLEVIMMLPPDFISGGRICRRGRRRARGVDRQRQIELIFRGVRERADRALIAGVGKDHIEPVPMRDSRIERRLHLSSVGDVANGDHDRVLWQIPRGALQGLVSQIQHHDLGAFSQ